MTWPDARHARALPLGLAEHARVVQPIRTGQALTYDNCAVDETKTIVRLRTALDRADARFERADEAA